MSTESNQEVKMNVRPLELGSNKIEQWRLFKRRWNNYVILSNLSVKPREFQVALLENCLSDDVLRTYEGFNFSTPESQKTTLEIIDKFEHYAVGEVNETFERYVFHKRVQSEGETFEQFESDLRVLIKTCSFCENCVESVVRDRIVLGIRNPDIRQELLKKRKLTLAECVDTCRAMESATTHGSTLNSTTVNSIKQKHRKTIGNSKTSECLFCGLKHPFAKEKCPAYGKKCTKCGIKNHAEKVCKTKKQSYQNTHHKSKVNKITEDEIDKNEDWLYQIKDKKSIICKMEVNNKPIRFQIDTGASVNMIPRHLVKSDIRPYQGILSMWNNTVVKPDGITTETIHNPKNRKKLSCRLCCV